jgi:hypothetical protein
MSLRPIDEQIELELMGGVLRDVTRIAGHLAWLAEPDPPAAVRIRGYVKRARAKQTPEREQAA